MELQSSHEQQSYNWSFVGLKLSLSHSLISSKWNNGNTYQQTKYFPITTSDLLFMSRIYSFHTKFNWCTATKEYVWAWERKDVFPVFFSGVDAPHFQVATREREWAALMMWKCRTLSIIQSQLDLSKCISNKNEKFKLPQSEWWWRRWQRTQSRWEMTSTFVHVIPMFLVCFASCRCCLTMSSWTFSTSHLNTCFQH